MTEINFKITYAYKAYINGHRQPGVERVMPQVPTKKVHIRDFGVGAQRTAAGGGVLHVC